MPVPISVLVVDDSAFMRKMVSEMISADPAFVVVAQARNGEDALAKVEQFHPDIITLDVEMPVMDGFAALIAIMHQNPTPVVMLSSLTQAGADMTLKCLEHGAIDFVGKPSGSISLDIERVACELVVKLKSAATAKVRPHRLYQVPSKAPDAEPPKRPLPESICLPVASVRPIASRSGRCTTPGVLVVGSSTGGPRALQSVIPNLPADLEFAVVVVQHMPAGFTESLARRLNDLSPLHVREAAEGDILEAGTVLVAPGGHHLQFDSSGRAHLTSEPPVHGVRPSFDVTLASLAPVFGGNMVGVILTGMGKDGARGLKTIHDLGAATVAEDESTCIVFGMPKAAIELGGIDVTVPLPEIADAALRAVKTLCSKRMQKHAVNQ